MKVLAILLSSLLAFNVAFAEEAAPAKPEVKKICIDLVVKGKKQKQCKNVKMHKKFEGTKVPTPAPKAPAAKKGKK